MAGRSTRCLKVDGIAADITDSSLKLLFENKKRYGGGCVANIERNNASSAVITFEEPDAVNLILSRGNTVNIKGNAVTVTPLLPPADDDDDDDHDGDDDDDHDDDDDDDDDDSENSEEEDIGDKGVGKSSDEQHCTNKNDIDTKNSSDDSDPEFFTVKGRNDDTSKLTEDDSNDTDEFRMNPANEQFHHMGGDRPKPQQKQTPKTAHPPGGVASNNTGKRNSPRKEDVEVEDKPVYRTVKAEVKKHGVSKQMYILYLDDFKYKYDELSLVMDDLNGFLYVVFLSKKDAEQMCQINHEIKEASIIRSMTMASPDDLAFYPNVISVHGLDFSDPETEFQLKPHVKKWTGKPPERVILNGDEPHSAIIQFGDRLSPESLYKIVWDCKKELNGVLLATAPVSVSSTISVSGILKNMDNPETWVERYFKSKEIGAPVKCCRMLDSGQMLVTFVNIKDCRKVNDHKNLELSGVKLESEMYNHCLSKEAYDSFLLRQGDSSTSYQKKMKSDKHGIRTKKEIDLRPEKCYRLFEITDILSTLNTKYPNALMTLVAGSNKILVEADSPHILQLVQLEIGQILNEICPIEVGEDYAHYFPLLSKLNAQDRMDTLFKEKEIKACIVIVGEKIKMYAYDKESRQKVYSTFKSVLKSKSYNLKPEEVHAFQSDEGKRILENEDSCYTCIKIMPDGKEVHILGFVNDAEELYKRFSEFLNVNALVSKEMTISIAKMEFMKKYMSQEIASMNEDLKRYGSSFALQEEKIVMKCKKGDIQVTERKFALLRDTISHQDLNLPYPGIKEFISGSKGTKILKDTGDSCRCMIIHDVNQDSHGAGSTASVKRVEQAKYVGSCQLEQTKIEFFVGNICSLTVDAVVSMASVEDSRIKLKCGVAKAIFSSGGKNIEQELCQSVKDSASENIIETGGGCLPFHIFHILNLDSVDEQNKGKLGPLRQALFDCLEKAEGKGYKSVGFPLLGCESFGLNSHKASLALKQAVEQFIKKNSKSGITTIYLCDKKENGIREMMQFDDITTIPSFKAEINDSNDNNPGQGTKKFGPVNLTITKGNLLEEKSDAIAVAVKDSMNLSDSGAVCKAILQKCGRSFQQDCLQKMLDLATSGAVLLPNHGLPCSHVIMVDMTKYSRHWNDGIKKILSLAEENGLANVSLPVFGASAKGADLNTIKRSVMRGIEEFSKQSPKSMKNVTLIVGSRTILNVFTDQEQHSDKRHSQEEETSLEDVQLSSETTVKVYSDQMEARIKAIAKLKENIQDEFKTRRTNIENLHLLSDNQFKKVIKKGAEYNLCVKRQASDLILTGFEMDNGIEVNQLVNDLLRRKLDDEHKGKIAKVPTAIQWEFKRGDRWNRFEAAMNFEIESVYKNSKSTAFITASNGHHYILDFTEMKEFTATDDKNKKKELCEIRRRDRTRRHELLPKRWDRMDKGENLKVVLVQPDSPEFQSVESNFKSAGVTKPIKKLERIQNKALYQQYNARMKLLENQNPKGTENEKRLFHGTDSTSITLINENGFNRSYCGKNATAYGEGVYFAVESSYSDRYAAADPQGEKKMYQVRVLVGVSTPSTSGMKHLPMVPGTNIPYDSGSAGNIFIIFHDAQAYPEYVITF